MKKIILSLLISFIAISSQAQDLKAFAIFNKDGKEVTYNEMIKEISKADVVFFGEHHNCPIAHWLEFEVAKSLVKKHKSKLAIGFEMLEADNQMIVDEYMSGLVSYDRYLKEVRHWYNYESDYDPVVQLARDNKLKVIATNVPRRYAAMVNKNGLESLEKLSEEAKRFIAPLPIAFDNSSSENEMFSMMNMMSGGKAGDADKIAMAQSVKDATMAWFISENFEGKFLHLNGCFHSDFNGGIIPYLNQYKPNLKYSTICTVRQDEINKLGEESEGRADFVICIPTDMNIAM